MRWYAQWRFYKTMMTFDAPKEKVFSEKEKINASNQLFCLLPKCLLPY